MDNVVIWNDGTWCYEEDLQEYLEFMPDDYFCVSEDTFQEMLDSGEI